MADLDSVLELRLSELSTQLDKARRSADMAIDRERKLARENDSLKIELVKVRRKEEIANGLRDDLTRKIAAVQEELAEAKRMEEDAHIRERDLTSQNSILRGKLDRSRQREKAAVEMREYALAINAELKDELTEWNSKETVWKNAKDELTRESATLKDNLAAAKRNEEIAKSMNVDLAANNFILKRELEDMRKKEAVIGMKDELAQESSALKEELEEIKANNYQTMEQVRIVELECDDTQCERDHKLSRSADPLNIFEVCCPESYMSISLDKALDLLKSSLPPYPVLDWEKFYADFRHENLPGNGECKLCRKKCKISEVVRHFLSQEHTDKVRARDSGVLHGAVVYWWAKINCIVSEGFDIGIEDQGYDDSYTEYRNRRRKSPRRRRYTDDDL